MIDLLAAALIAMAPAPQDVYATEVGDDDGNGVISEDESGWSCVDMGNKTCGPNNPQGVLAALRRGWCTRRRAAYRLTLTQLRTPSASTV